eukprot:1867889-Pleurochrysis_carterae.AAC.1
MERGEGDVRAREGNGVQEEGAYDKCESVGRKDMQGEGVGAGWTWTPRKHRLAMNRGDRAEGRLLATCAAFATPAAFEV